jgi:hypothetical protein
LPVRAEYRCETFGYIESVDLERLSAELGAQDPDVEVELCMSVGQAVGTGDLIARIRHRDQQAAQQLRAVTQKAVPVSPTPDLDYDPRTALRNMANIGWTSGSTAKHSPAVAAQALHAMRDLASRWLAEGDRSGPDPAAVVYPDGDVEAVLDTLYSAVVVAGESRQHQQAGRVLEAYAFLWPRADARARRRMRRDVGAKQSVLDLMPPSPRLEEKREELRQLLDSRAEGSDATNGSPSIASAGDPAGRRGWN